jgi:ATP-dependent helicase/nuclease subunit A
MEHLDYRGACDWADIELQIATLVDRRLLRDDQAAAVDRAAIAWFCQTDLGQLLKKNFAKLRREIPFALAAETSSADAMDAVMIRGRIDLIVPTAGGVAVVDYKTDRIGRDEIDQRALTYETQIEVYKEALQRIAKLNVTDVYLVFLHPRIIWKGS